MLKVEKYRTNDSPVDAVFLTTDNIKSYSLREWLGTTYVTVFSGQQPNGSDVLLLLNEFPSPDDLEEGRSSLVRAQAGQWLLCDQDGHFRCLASSEMRENWTKVLPEEPGTGRLDLFEQMSINPPVGWFPYGTYSNMPLEYYGEQFSTDGTPLWERPILGTCSKETVHVGSQVSAGENKELVLTGGVLDAY